MQTLYILVGIPFAGKTSLAHFLKGKIDALVVSVDSINKIRGIKIIFRCDTKAKFTNVVYYRHY